MPILRFRSACRRVRPASSAGFSLIELLVAMVITSILMSVMFQVLQGQGQFARLQGAREEVQQNARAAMDIIAAEVRSIATAGIVDQPLAAGSLRFRAPVLWGTVCGTDGTRVLVAFADNSNALVGLESRRLAVRIGAGEWSFPADDENKLVTGADLAGAAAICTAMLTDPTRDEAFTPGQVRVFDNLAPGGYARYAPAYLYEDVEYRVGAAPNVGGNWILRNGVPLAGPVPATNALTFTYRDFTGAPTTQRLEVSEVQIQVVTNSRARFNNQPQRNTARTAVYLPNANQL